MGFLHGLKDYRLVPMIHSVHSEQLKTLPFTQLEARWEFSLVYGITSAFIRGKMCILNS